MTEHVIDAHSASALVGSQPPLPPTQKYIPSTAQYQSPHLEAWAMSLLHYEEAFAPYDETGNPITATLEEILQTVAQWYVRKNNKYYDVDIPGEELSRDDVERVIIQRLKTAFPGNDLPQDVVRQLLQRLIRDIFVSPRESIPIWSGVRRSAPGNPNKLMFSDHMTATDQYVALPRVP
jgi:chorismate mutase